MHDPDTNPLTNVAYTKARLYSQSDIHFRKSVLLTDNAVN
jgi:hypothetical protein